MSSNEAILITPAGPIKAESLDAALQVADALDITLAWPKGWRERLLQRRQYLAGDDAGRVSQLVDALNTEAERLWMARGGYGCIRTLAAAHEQGVEVFERPPTPLWGFSDGTALLGAWMRAGWPAWLSPPLTQLERLDPMSRARWRASWHGGEVPTFRGLKTLQEGRATAPLTGGNLAVLVSCLKTPFEVPMKGHILVLEDTGERAYKVDRLMTQLRLSGALDEIAGLIVGEFSHVSEDQKAQITQFFEQFAEGLSVPVVSQMPIGHDILNAPLPLGHATGFLATLDAPRGREATLTFSKVA